ncbi:MAG TPA: DnaA/Hda family protein [Burkholderiales bacterium]|nr:DnaA/Hda family protein [Burkholderiales bacterium]
MKQLALGISPPPQPTLDNFVPGANAELLTHLRRLRAGRFTEGVLYLWGEAGCGKSHLLAACAGANSVDDVQKLDDLAQIALFNAINEARETGGAVLAAGDAPPAQLPLREDLKSRLAWGLVYQVKPPSDEERAAFLRAESERRGFRLADEVISYLLTRMRRDLRSLTSVLERLDQYSLETKRPITLPLVRDALKE